MTLLLAAGTLGALGALLTTLLVIAHRLLGVDEDPRLQVLEEALPGNNCGACGYPGCRAFAEALASGDAEPAACTVSTVENRQRIADYLGVGIGTAAGQVARLACAGGDNVASRSARYQGAASCSAAALTGGGGKSCSWGCLGFGDCEAACTFDAITLDRHRLPWVDEDRCTACGDCVSACPRDLFSLEPADRRLWVACRNPEAGNGLVDSCAVACTACGKCAFDAPGAVTMAGNLPLIDPTAAPPEAAIERCPTGAIVWMEGGVGRRGREAVEVVRINPLPVATT